jgi:hypothetical protein
VRVARHSPRCPSGEVSRVAGHMPGCLRPTPCYCRWECGRLLIMGAHVGACLWYCEARTPWGMCVVSGTLTLVTVCRWCGLAARCECGEVQCTTRMSQASTGKSQEALDSTSQLRFP